MAESATGTATDTATDTVVGDERQPPADDLPPSQTAAAAEGQVAVATPPVVPAATAEQLARWQIPQWEPLELLSCLDPPDVGFVSHVLPTRDGGFVLGGSQVTLWKPAEDTPQALLLEPAADSQRRVTALGLAPDGSWLCAGDSEGQLHVWQLSDRRLLATKTLYPTPIVAVAISPAGDELATITHGQEVSIWDTAQWTVKRRFEVAAAGVERLAYAADGRLVAAGESTSVWNTASGQPAEQLAAARYQFAIAPVGDGKYFAYATDTGLQFARLPELSPVQLWEGDFRGVHMAFSPDRRQLATSAGRDIVIRQLPGGQVLQVIEATGPAVTGVAWLADSGLLLSVNELGRIRLWGTPAAGRPLQLQPLHTPLATAARAEAPASPAQIAATIDLLSLPRLPGAKGNIGSDTMLHYTVASTVEEAKAFYHHLLGSRGWQAVPPDPNTPDYLTFTRDGCGLFIVLGLYDGQLNVSLTSQDDVDVRQLPKLDADQIQMIYESASSTSYTTPLDLLTIETALLRRMHAAGWVMVERLNASHDDEDDVRELEFYRGAGLVRISIRRQPVAPDRYTVQYTKFLAMASLPVPADVGVVEADLVSGEPRLVATTGLSLAETREFYDTQLAAQGWLPREERRLLREKDNWLNYIRGHRDLTLGLTSGDDQQTLIRVGEGLENLSWQLKRKSPATDAATAGSDSAESPAVGIEAADFPLPSGAKSVAYQADSKELRFEIEPAQSDNLVKELLAALAPLGWTPTREGIREATYVFLTFGKDKREIDVRANIRDGVATVSVQGDGLLGSKPVQATPKLSSYASWLRNNRHPASLQLLDTYEAQMRSLKP